MGEVPVKTFCSHNKSKLQLKTALRFHQPLTKYQWLKVGNNAGSLRQIEICSYFSRFPFSALNLKEGKKRKNKEKTKRKKEE